tara:strand:- start:3729 stop:4598 length:870 start_codon:yes stop_codon:yes gene_type:complete
MYALNITSTKTISDLEKFMLNSIKKESSSAIENLNTDADVTVNTNADVTVNTNADKSKSIVPRNNIYVNYNKLKSKYNEKPGTFKKNHILNDKLFWCFYKLYNKVNDTDLEYINIFTTEKEFKLSVIEKIKNNKDLLKKHKIQINAVVSEITNDKQITLPSFKTLCILYNLNIIVIKDNNTYTRFTNYNLENTIDNLDNYDAIKLLYKNSSGFNTNYVIQMELDKAEIQNAVSNFYYVKNLDKPLKSLSGYNLQEIIEIANKLEISILRDNGKKKTKTELYSDSVKKVN